MQLPISILMPLKAFSTRWRAPRFMRQLRKWRGRGCALKSALIAANRRLFSARRAKRRAALCWPLTIIAARKKTSPAKNILTPIWTMAKAAYPRFLQFRANIRAAGLEGTVIPALSPSQVVARLPMAAPALVFIDGGHSMPAALADWQNWGARVMAGGFSPFMMSSLTRRWRPPTA